MGELFVAALIGAAVGSFVTIVICCIVFGEKILDFKREAVKRGFAAHNPKNGEWEWHVLEKEPDEP